MSGSIDVASNSLASSGARALIWICLTAAFGLGVVISSFTGRRDHSTLELPASSSQSDEFAVPEDLLDEADDRESGASSGTPARTPDTTWHVPERLPLATGPVWPSVTSS